MISAGQFKKGIVVALDGSHWLVEDYHTQQTARRHGLLQVRLRNLKTHHVAERTFDETDKVEQPELESRAHQFLYEDAAGYVFMDEGTFEQVTVPRELVGEGRWQLKAGEEFTIRFIDGRPAQVVFPPVFVDTVVETAEPTGAAHGGHVLKDARLACGLEVKVPLFIKAGDPIRVETETHRYHGKESARPAEK